MSKVDAHHHFWRYSRDEYGWIDESMGALRRDFLPEHLQGEMRQAQVSGVISVQARQSLEETEWLLHLAEAHPFIRGVAGWAPLSSDKIELILQHLSANPKLRAVRHVIQDEPDDQFILREDFNRGIGMLRRFGLRYDILIFERHLPQTLEFVDRHPDQIFILDHLAKPRIRANQLEPWRQNLLELARRPNVWCKISGMVTEANWHAWTPRQLEPYFNAALEAFGPRRLMFCSDWPVCLVASSYTRWAQTVEQWCSRLSDDEKQWIFARSACEAYGICL